MGNPLVSAAQIGSGTQPFTGGIRYGFPQTDGSTAKGYRWGSNVVIVNPEDMFATPYFKTSGELILNDGNVYELPNLHGQLTRRSIRVVNLGPGHLFLGHNSGVMDLTNSLPLIPASQLGGLQGGGAAVADFPFLCNVRIFAMASGAHADARWMEY